MRIFQKLKNIFFAGWRNKVAWCRGYATCHLNLKLGSVIPKCSPFYFNANVINFFAINFGIYCLENYTKFLKLGPEYLIHRYFPQVFSFLSSQIFRSCRNTPKHVTSWRGPSTRHCAQVNNCKLYLFFGLRLAISQAGIVARTLTIMQGSEEKGEKN